MALTKSRTATTVRRLEVIESAFKPAPPDRPEIKRLSCVQMHRVLALHELRKDRPLTSAELAEIDHMQNIVDGDAESERASCPGVVSGEKKYERWRYWCMRCPNCPEGLGNSIELLYDDDPEPDAAAC